MRPTYMKFGSTEALRRAYVAGARPQLCWTVHALERVVAMKKQGMSMDEVSEAVVEPDEIGYSFRYKCVLLVGKRVTLSVGLDADGLPNVQTVLWSTAEGWLASYESAGVQGRERRSDLGHLRKRRPA